ncbi:MAG: sulfatase-like hydrolase/transferase, partial [Planctomycetota bacterium]
DADGEDVFLWLHLFDAHAPYRPPGVRTDVSAAVSAGAPAIEITSEMLSGRGVPGWLRDVQVSGIEEIRGWYGDEGVAIDAALESLLSRPRIAEGWVALTSDHGENLGENRRTFEHTGLFQPVLQVPMILAGPGVPTLRSSAGVQQFSVGRTLLDLAGVDAAFPGRSLLESAENEDRSEPRFGLSCYGDQASITAGKWLLTLGLRTDTRHREAPDSVAGRVHLFDRSLGIQSEENFAEAEPEVTAKLHAALRAWLNAQGETPPLAEAGVRTTRAQKRLRALGYSGRTTDGDQRWWDPDRVEDPKWRVYW